MPLRNRWAAVLSVFEQPDTVGIAGSPRRVNHRYSSVFNRVVPLSSSAYSGSMELCVDLEPSLQGGTEFLPIRSHVVIQEVATKRYFRAPGVWSVDEAHALKFQTISAAHKCADRLNLTNVQVVSSD